jgi:hypothetical protein
MVILPKFPSWPRNTPDSLPSTPGFELASYAREGWIWDRETLEKGPQPTQYKK